MSFTSFETARPAEDRLYIISLMWCDCSSDRFCPRCQPAAAAPRTHPLPAHTDDEDECELDLQVRIERQLFPELSNSIQSFDFFDDRDDRFTEDPARGPPLECHTKESFREVRHRWTEEQRRQCTRPLHTHSMTMCYCRNLTSCFAVASFMLH